MKKIILKISIALSKLSLSSANAGAGFASTVGFHQPKVPERISK